MNLSFTDAKLRQGRSRKISCTYRVVKVDRALVSSFFYKRASLKARIHDTKNLMLDNTRINRWTQISEDLKC